uniref:Uncharacterized protein n=1 Tax=Timema bartmani TaxID=61472 RepID=A0A7R9I4Y1_9NEOP|nr:unnamed protein product [Timema bartmani]
MHLVKVQFLFLVLSLRQHLSHINSRLRDGVTERSDVVECAEYHAGVVDAARLVNSSYSFINLTAVTSTFILCIEARMVKQDLRDGVTERSDVVECAEYHAGVVDAARLVNSSYSFINLTSVTSTFILVTTSIFLYAYVWRMSSNASVGRASDQTKYSKECLTNVLIHRYEPRYLGHEAMVSPQTTYSTIQHPNQRSPKMGRGNP